MGAEKVALFLGAGFSKSLGLPLTKDLETCSLADGAGSDQAIRRETFISRQIEAFWQATFGWKPEMNPPSLEDHFTQLDLSANSGHALGLEFPPNRLRAIRRMSIHRICRLLKAPSIGRPSLAIQPAHEFLTRIAKRFRGSVITTNWDIEAETHLRRAFLVEIGLPMPVDPGLPNPPPPAIQVLKLHGSLNWAYCDCCRYLTIWDIAGFDNQGLLLDPDDFRLFDGGEAVAVELENQRGKRVPCAMCGYRPGFRIATPSYRKDLSVRFLQTIWDAAQGVLSEAQRWLFVGYSMPEADVEIRHLIKTAQLARESPERLLIDVVLGDDKSAGERYMRFFGKHVTVHQDGIEGWLRDCSQAYCARPG